jgi:hypothetical protein
MASLLDRVSTAELQTEIGDEFPAEFADQFEQDLPSAAFAEPAPIGRKLRVRAPKQAPVSATMKRRIAAEIQLYLEMVVGVGEMYCSDCAAVWEEHSKKIADRAAAIIARYPDMAEKFIGSGMIAEIVALGAALRQPVKQIVGHHVTHTISHEHEEPADDGDYAAYAPYRPAA